MADSGRALREIISEYVYTSVCPHFPAPLCLDSCGFDMGNTVTSYGAGWGIRRCTAIARHGSIAGEKSAVHALNDVSELNDWRDGLGLLAIGLLLIILLPAPRVLVQWLNV